MVRRGWASLTIAALTAASARAQESAHSNFTVGSPSFVIARYASVSASSLYAGYSLGAAGVLVAMVSRADALRWTVEGWDIEKTLVEQLLGQNLVVGYEDELVGKLADRMAEVDAGRIPILRRGASDEESTVVGLVARRDLLRVRAEVIRHERDREKLIRLRA